MKRVTIHVTLYKSIDNLFKSENPYKQTYSKENKII